MTNKQKYETLELACGVLLLLVLGLGLKIVHDYRMQPLHDQMIRLDEQINMLERQVEQRQEELKELEKALPKSNTITEYELIQAIIRTESNGNPNAISFLGKDYGIGLMQVSKIALKDYNLWNGTDYSQSDLFDPEINVTIGTWIYNHNTHYGIPDTIEAKLTAYNCGAKYYKVNGTRDTYVTKVLNNLIGDITYAF